MHSDKPKIIVVVGPTASGKSKLAIDIAKKFPSEIISADSRQVYRGLDIGTAKLTEGEMGRIPHHLIDIVDINTVYTVAEFNKDAQRVIQEILKRGNIPIVCGGTFFYVDALLGKVSTPNVVPNPELRERLESMTEHALYEALLKLDPRRASDIDPKNKRRLVRALEVISELGKVPETKVIDLPYNALVIGIETNKKDLREKLRTRGQQWIHAGFEKETKDLLNTGVSRDRLAEIGFEYQLCLDLIDKKITTSEFITQFEQKNWQYAKRQLTWLKRDRSIRWISLSDSLELDLMIEQFLQTN